MSTFTTRDGTDGSFVAEKGFLLVTDHATRYDDVADGSGNTSQLSRSWGEFAQRERAPSMGDERGVVWPTYGDEGGGGLLGTASPGRPGDSRPARGDKRG